MMCEVCGRELPRTKTVTIEGTVLNACPDCARFGTEAGPVASPARKPGVPPAVSERLPARGRPGTGRGGSAPGGPPPRRIRAAGEARGWKQTDLGARINERVTVIAKLESGTMVPNDDLIRRLERALEIKLKEKAPAPVVRKATAREGVTLGDLFDLKGEG